MAKKRLNKGPRRRREKIKASNGSSRTKTMVHVRKVVDKYSSKVMLISALFRSSLKSVKNGESVWAKLPKILRASFEYDTTFHQKSYLLLALGFYSMPLLLWLHPCSQ